MARYSASGVKSFAKTRTPPKSEVAGRGLGNPHLVGVRRAMLRGLRFGKRTGALEVPRRTSGTKFAAVSAGDLDGFSPDIREPPTDGSPIASMPKQMARGAVHSRFFLPHSSSASRLMAGASAFFILSQSGRPFRLIVDGTGTVIQRSIIDFGHRPLPAAIPNRRT